MNIFYYNFKKANTYLLILILTICFFATTIFYYLNITNQKRIDTTLNDNIQNRKITIFTSEIDKEKIQSIDHVVLVLENYYSAVIEYKEEEISLTNILLYDEKSIQEGEVIVPRTFNLKIDDDIEIKSKKFRIAGLSKNKTIYMNGSDIFNILDERELNEKNYLIIVDDYKNSDKVLKTINELNIEANKSILDTRKVDNLKKIINRIAVFNNIVSIISIIMIVEIYIYTFKEETKNISLLKLLGYSNITINTKLFNYTNILMLTSFLITALFSALINYYLIHIKFYNINMFSNIIYNIKLFYIYIAVIVFFFFINSIKIKKIKPLENI